jgi:UDP-N-acetylmuramyl tripeptide synthase
VLEIAVDAASDAALLAGWRSRVARAAAHLDWAQCQSRVRMHAAGASLALAAPCDQLFLATEVNEWALCAAFAERDPSRRSGLEKALVAAALDAAAGTAAGVTAEYLPVIDEAAALRRFTRLAKLESNPGLMLLLEAAAAHSLCCVLDELELTVGSGAGGRSYPLGKLPNAADVPWKNLRNVPTAIVTGSNGKTTTVRLLAACARANGWAAGYNCTDGVWVEDQVLATGDYSGPAGARRVLRAQNAEAAILETARGGILRRGIAESRADVALVTNVSSDHFGEYGIDDLAGLADVKLTVAAVVPADGLLVLNADDPQLTLKAGSLRGRFGRTPPLGWFALDWHQRALQGYRSEGASTCGVRDGRLCMNWRGVEHDLGRVSDMPLSIGGVAIYNIGNLAAAALAAAALGIGAGTIAAVFAQFGDRLEDNPGRMMRFEVAGRRVLVDYAHNPDGLRGFLAVANHLRGGAGRLGLLLGHAGNRKNADIEELARVAAGFRPDLVVIKEDDAHMRGREAGEIPRIIRAELIRQGLPESTLPVRDSEMEAVRCALDWARPGDLLALPVHSAAARAAVVAMLKELQSPG